jgi:DNA-binding beta-propeller fold protein YncE
MKTLLLYCSLAITLTLVGNNAFAQAPNFQYNPSTNVLTLGTAFTLSPTPNAGGGAVAPLAFGTAITLGTGTSSLHNPYGMAVDPSGNIYVANYTNGTTTGTISEYNSSGTFVNNTFGSSLIKNPAGLVFDASGNAYVLNYGRTNNGNGNQNGNAYVAQYTSTGTYVSTIIPTLGTANGITIDASGNLYVAQGNYNGGNNLVSQYNTSGLLTFSVGGSPNTTNPVAVAVDGSGNIYVLDNAKQNVTKYNSTGIYQSIFISSGLTNPNAIYIDGGGNIYVGDSGTGGTTGSVKVYNAAGTLLTSITGLTDPRGIVTDGKGNLYVSDFTNNTIQRFPKVGGYVLTGALPAGLHFDGTTGIFSGTPTISFAAITYTVTAYNASGSGNTTVTLSCPSTSAPTISYNPSINVYTIGAVITSLSPTTTGIPNSFTISPTLPAGLSIAPSTGVISGTPTAASPATLYTVTCSNGLSSSTTVSIACVIDDFWNGSTSTDWNDKNNWSVGVPGPTDLASIGVSFNYFKNGKSNKTNEPTILSGSVSVDYITFGAAHSGILTVQTGATLTINNILTISKNATPTLTGIGTGAINLIPAAVVNISTNGALTIDNSASTANFVTLQSDATGSATVSQIPTSGSITGTVNVQRYLSAGTTAVPRGYRFLSSPVYTSTSGGNNIYSINYIKLSVLTTGTGGTAGGFDKFGNPTFYLFRDDVALNFNSFIGGNYRGVTDMSLAPSYSVNIDGSGFHIPVGNGFQFFDRGDRINQLAIKYISTTIAESVTLTASGTLNTGPITVHPWFKPASSNLDYTAVSGNSTVIGLALVGNPYASSIDWDKYSATAGTGIYAPSVTKFIYVYNQVNRNYNIYQSGFGGIGTLGNNSNIIPSGEGFFVCATSSSAQLVFNEDSKTSTQANATNGNLYLGKPVQSEVVQYLHLMLIKDDVNKDGTIISFKSSAKPQFDANEDAAYRPGNGILSLSTTSADNIALAFNARPLPDKTQLIIPLNVNAYSDGTYNLYLATLKSIPDLYDVWLMDAYQKDSLDIKHNPTYSFNITQSVPATYGSTRFSLVIRQNQAKGVHLLSFTASKVSGGSQITWKTENEQNYTYFTVERSTNGGTTFDVIGSVTSSAQGTYSFLDKAPVKGTDKYRLKIEDLNGTITYSQIVSLDYGDSKNNSPNIIVYPNPVSNTINLSIIQNNGSTSKLSYGIKVVNITGTVVKNGNTKTATWQENASNLTPGTYVVQVVNNNDNSLVGKTTFIKL